MTAFPFVKPATAIVVLRIGLSILLMIHGCFRLFTGSVSLFGGYLQGVGIPPGHGVAWALTLFEIIGGALMALGLFTRWVAVGYMLEILMGIIMVHARNGWFVVGHSTGGVEYSILILLTLFTIAATAKSGKSISA